MAWSYDPTVMGTSTDAERLNSVRFLSGDTDTTDQLVQNEEIVFALSQTSNNIYYAAAFICDALANKFASLASVQLDGALEVDYNWLSDKYMKLAESIRTTAKRTSGGSMGIYAGGIYQSAVETARDINNNRVKPAFYKGQFSYDIQD